MKAIGMHFVTSGGTSLQGMTSIVSKMANRIKYNTQICIIRAGSSCFEKFRNS